MDFKKDKVIARLGMAAPLEVPEAGEQDFVAIAQKKSLIIECTLEQAEAALKAALATPSEKDDAFAMQMLHWGSYRFYLNDQTVSLKK